MQVEFLKDEEGQVVGAIVRLEGNVVARAERAGEWTIDFCQPVTVATLDALLVELENAPK
jgi:hypothetical protein